jgi:hypothetical protein
MKSESGVPDPSKRDSNKVPPLEPGKEIVCFCCPRFPQILVVAEMNLTVMHIPTPRRGDGLGIKSVEALIALATIPVLAGGQASR